MNTCSFDGCERETKRSGFCWAHLKQMARKQRLRPVAQLRKSSGDRLTECIHAYVDADTEADFARARDNLRKAIAAHRSTAISELTREGMARRKREGVHVGRPHSVNPRIAAAMVELEGSIRKAAARLQVSASSIFRALRRRKDGRFERAPF